MSTLYKPYRHVCSPTSKFPLPPKRGTTCAVMVLPGAIADNKRLIEQLGFCGDSAHTQERWHFTMATNR
jgi:hypothetical protein